MVVNSVRHGFLCNDFSLLLTLRVWVCVGSLFYDMNLGALSWLAILLLVTLLLN